MQKERKNHRIFIGAFLIILLLLFFSLGKIFWQKKQTQKNSTTKNSANTTEEKNPQKLFSLISPQEVEQKIGQTDYLIIDLRPDFVFEDCHIESSLNLSPEDLEKLPAENKNKKIIIVDDFSNDSNIEKILNLQKNGFQIFYLDGGFEKYKALGLSTISFGYPDSPFDVAKTKPIDSATLKSRLENGEKFKFLDVRSTKNFEKSHISGSVNLPLEELEKRKTEVPFGRLVVVDNNPLRAFQAAVRLFDLHFIDVVYLSEDLEKLRN